MKQLTARQLQVYNAIIDYWRENAMPPSCRELADQLGIASPNAIYQHLKALRAKGLVIDGTANRSRSIVPAAVAELLSSLQRGYLMVDAAPSNLDEPTESPTIFPDVEDEQ